MKKKLTEKQKKMAYVLNQDDDFNCTMAEVGALFKVSGSTISNAIKDVRHQIEINSLQDELANLKCYIIEENIVQPVALIPTKAIDIIDVTPTEE